MGLPVFAIKSLTGGNGADARVDEILRLIPSQATEENQLGDKEFINSSIATNTAHYIYKTVGGEKVPFDSVAELEAYSGTVTPNDYAFVTGTDTAGNRYYDRYKATVNESVVTWAKEYRLNNSSFTAEQFAAINSGITTSLVSKLNSIHGVYVMPYKTDYTNDELNGIKTAFTLGEFVVCRVQYGGTAAMRLSFLYDFSASGPSYNPYSSVYMSFWTVGPGELGLDTGSSPHIKYTPDGYRYTKEGNTRTWNKYFNSTARLYHDSTLTHVGNGRLGVNSSVVAMKSDVYTKTEMDTALQGKADASSVYTKTEVDTALQDKADADDVYTKTEMDASLALKANASDVKTATAFTCEMANGTTKTLTMNAVLS